jgi:ATP-dependent Clp protease ATP-binding subunit ClpC
MVVAKLEVGDDVRERGRRHTPFTPLAKQVLEGALNEALQLAHNYIGTEHLLLGLFRVSDGLAAQILGDLDVTHDRVRADVVERLTAAS